MKVFVTGGTGFIGIPLVRSLLDEGHEVVALARDVVKAQNETRSYFTHTGGLRFVAGDLAEPARLANLMEGCEAVFHLAGVISYIARERELMRGVNTIGARNVAQASLWAGVKRLVHVSSIVAVGVAWDPSRPLDEQSPYNAASLKLGYFDSKHDAEAEVLSLVRGGLDAVLVNPATVVGLPEESGRAGSVNQSMRLFARAPFTLPGGNCWVDVRDVVQGILLAWKKGRNGARYVLGADNIEYFELSTRIRAQSGKPAPRIQLKPSWILAIARLARIFERLGIPTPLHSQMLTRISGFYLYFDSSLARRELGWRPRSAWPAILAMSAPISRVSSSR